MLERKVLLGLFLVGCSGPDLICGDGVIVLGEACDDGNAISGDGCDGFCRLEPFCGDGTISFGEQCDDGNTQNGDSCDELCQIEAFCGDTITDANEECDDGNTDEGDGCNGVCLFEAPKTDYRFSKLGLLDDVHIGRFNNTNLLLSVALGNTDLTKALHILVKFDSTADGTEKVVVGPGLFDPLGNDFSFLTTLNNVALPVAPSDASISNGAVSFATAQIVFPIEVQFGSGIFAPLALNNVQASSFFEKQQNQNDLFFDFLSDESTFDGEVKILDLCALNIRLGAGLDPINLLDIFDDGVSSQPGNIPSSTTTPEGVSPDATNCIVCSSGNPDCILPEVDPDGTPNTGDESYQVKAGFEAKNEGVVIDFNFP
jgi:cysteine-rich repeat protein